MIRRRSLCLLALTAAAFLPSPVQAQAEDWKAVQEALEQGKNEEALTHLQKILSADISNEQAFELWNNTENRVWLKLLTQGGELELVAQELVAKAKLGRKKRQDNPDAVRELVKELANDDVIARTKVTNQLASDYGEYAVPILIYSLTEGSDPDRRVNVMTALTRMGSDVVPPLIEVMDAPDAFLRRNVALTLGYIKDPRALPVLSRARVGDPDVGVRNAAEQALSKMGGGGDAGQLYFDQGEAYYREDDSVLAPYQYSDVIWRWEDKGLLSTEVPRFLYAPEMAKKSYYRALALLSDAGPALSGIARCATTENGRLDEWVAAGQDAGDWPERLQSDELAAQVAGPEALDMALGWASAHGDLVAASGLCRLLAKMGKTATANLSSAQSLARSGSVQGEAAVALGRIAYRNREAASSETVSALATYAGKEILRIGAVIGGDEASARALEAQLAALGYHTTWWKSGTRGLISMRTLPGIDLLILNEKPTDLTPRAVVNEVRSDPRFARTQILIQTSAMEADESMFGQVNGILSPGDDLAAATEAASSEPMNRDREEALDLAARSAETLFLLASGGRTEVGPATESLAATLGNRPDGVVVPALGVLQFVGGASHVERIAAVLTATDRSETVRTRAANALAGIFSRTGSAESGLIQMLQEVAQKDDSFLVRGATAAALGRLNLSKELRVELMRGLLSR